LTDLPSAGGDPAVTSPAGMPASADSAPPRPESPAADWSRTLDAELGALVEAKGWASPSEAVRSYQALECMLGADKIAIPSKDAKPEAWDAVWQKLGRPAKPEGYGFAKSTGLADYDEATAEWARAAFHKAGLPQRMATELHESYLKHRAERGTALAAAERRAEAELDAALSLEWGAAREGKTAIARRAAQSFADGPETIDRLERAIGTAAVLKLFARIGEAMGEDRMLGAGGPGGRLAPADAEAEIRRIRGEAMKDPRHPLVDKTHPDHARLVHEMEGLYGAAYPS
jgi:hypothetical protein